MKDCLIRDVSAKTKKSCRSSDGTSVFSPLAGGQFTTCERFLDLPRKQELMALVNRMRKINMVKGGGVV